MYFKGKIKENVGITLVSLVVTIIILLILAGITISTLVGDNGIITNALYAKFSTEVKQIEEEIQLKQIMFDSSYTGSINDFLEIESNYNNKLIIQEGNLVYVASEVSSQETKWLENLGIEPSSDYFTVEFDTGVNTLIASQTIKINNKAVQPANPTNADFEFIGWYYVIIGGTETNPTYTEKAFDFDTEITQDYSLYAKYKNEAILKSRSDTAFWQEKYRTKITSVDFNQAEINVPLTAIESWDVKADDNCSEVGAYIEDDGTENETYKLTIVSPYTIYANTNASSYFSDFSNLISVVFDNFDTSKVMNMRDMFSGCSKMTSLNISNFNTKKVTGMMHMFDGCNQLEFLDVSNFDTSKVKNMGAMFMNCSKLSSLDVSNFNTNKVTHMGDMFNGCSKITSLNVSNFNTKEVTYMAHMFNGCNQLTILDVSNFDTSKVTTMYSMFSGCNQLTILNVSNFDTSEVKNMTAMFRNCSKLTSLDLSNFNTNKVTNMGHMFNGCIQLTNLNVSNFNTNEVTNMAHMFNGCNNLNELNLKNWDVANLENVTSDTNMFNGIPKSAYIYVDDIDMKNWILNIRSNFENIKVNEL